MRLLINSTHGCTVQGPVRISYILASTLLVAGLGGMEFKGTLKEIQTLFRIDRDDDYMILERRLRSGAVDFHPIHQLVSPTETKPHYEARVCWGCFDYLKGRIKRREFTFLEHRNVVIDKSGTRSFLFLRSVLHAFTSTPTEG